MVNNRIEEVLKEVWKAGRDDSQVFDFFECLNREGWISRIRQLFPQPLDDKELGKAIQDILDTAITVDNNCNEITKKVQILALLQPKIEEAKREERERIIADLKSWKFEGKSDFMKGAKAYRSALVKALKGEEQNKEVKQ